MKMDKAVNFLVMTLLQNLRKVDSSGLCFIISAGGSKPRARRSSWGWLRIALESKLYLLSYHPPCLEDFKPMLMNVILFQNYQRADAYTYCCARLGVMYIETKLKGETWTFIIFSFYWDALSSTNPPRLDHPSSLSLTGCCIFSSTHFQLPLPGPLALKLLLWSIHSLQDSFPQLVLGFDKGISPESFNLQQP